MNLYLVSQDFNQDWDTFDAFVCVAESEEQARKIYPCYSEESIQSTWASNEHIKVKYIGMALSTMQTPEIILTSFNAG